MDYKRWQMLKTNYEYLDIKERLELINFEKTNKRQVIEYVQRQKADNKKIKEIMSIKNEEARRNKIAQNLDLFEFQKR